jgi:hypothetical protein
MPPVVAGLRFPHTRVLLPRTRLAYIHLRNLLTDAKRDRAARISGYVAVSLPEEVVILYLVAGEVANATTRTRNGSRALSIARAIGSVPSEPEYGEVCFHEADPEQLACMHATQSMPPEAWPDDLAVENPAVLFPFLKSIGFEGVVEIIADDGVNYLSFRNGVVARSFLASAHHGTAADRVAKLFARAGRVGGLRIARWATSNPLPVQALPALVQAYRELASAIVHRLVDEGRDSAPAIAERVRQNLVEANPALDAFSFSGDAPDDPVVEAAALTAGVAAWIRDVMWAAVDHDAVGPDALLKELTWDRRHMFQSAGLFDQLPWKVM